MNSYNLQATKTKCAEQGNLLRHGGMQMPDLLHRHDQDGNIGQKVWYGITNKGSPEVDTGAIGPWYPCLVDGGTLEDTDEDNSNHPSNNNTADGIRRYLELAAGEDAQVHGQDGELDEGHGRDIHALEAE